MSDGLMISLASLLLTVGGIVLTIWFFRRGGSAKTKLRATLHRVGWFDPRTLGLDLTLRVGKRSVPNIALYELKVRNKGPRGLSVDDADDPEAQVTRARIQLPNGVRAVAGPWTVGRANAPRDVRVARELDAEGGSQLLHLHIHRLAAKQRAVIRILCSSDIQLQRKQTDRATFECGYLPDVTMKFRHRLFSVREMVGRPVIAAPATVDV